MSLDIDGVGELVRIAAEKGRATRPDIKLGICGEHGGDPASIRFCEEVGPRLRVLLALPRADRPAGGRAGGGEGCKERSRVRGRRRSWPYTDWSAGQVTSRSCSGWPCSGWPFSVGLLASTVTLLG